MQRKAPTLAAVGLAAVVPSLIILVNGVVTRGRRPRPWSSPAIAVTSGAVVAAATIAYFDSMAAAFGQHPGVGEPVAEPPPLPAPSPADASGPPPWGRGVCPFGLGPPPWGRGLGPRW